MKSYIIILLVFIIPISLSNRSTTPVKTFTSSLFNKLMQVIMYLSAVSANTVAITGIFYMFYRIIKKYFGTDILEFIRRFTEIIDNYIQKYIDYYIQNLDKKMDSKLLSIENKLRSIEDRLRDIEDRLEDQNLPKIKDIVDPDSINYKINGITERFINIMGHLFSITYYTRILVLLKDIYQSRYIQRSVLIR